MIDILWLLLAVFLLLDLVFVAVRTSLVNLRLPHLLNLHEQHEVAVDRTLALVKRPRLRVSLRLAVNIVHFLLAGATLMLYLRINPVDPSGLWVVVLAALGFLLLEYTLEGLVLRNPELWALRLSPLGNLLDILLTPFTLILAAASGNPPGMQSATALVTDDDLRNWVEAGQQNGSLEKEERKMIYSIFQFGDTLAREIMVPRIDVLALEINTLLSDAIDALRKSGHSRVPVYEETIDNVVGLLYAKDLLRVQGQDKPLSAMRELLRPAYFVPEAKKADELLAEMQSRRIHVAIVVDEYGGVAGLVTLEDIVEEIIGEVRDEYDASEEMLYQQVGPDEYIFQGRIDLDDFNEVMGTHLEKDVADTLGGFIYGQMGRVPAGGEQVQAGDVLLTVEQVSGRRIRKVRARRIQPESEMKEEESNADR